MGLYDRDYLHDDRPRSPLGDLSMVAKLVILNVAVFIVDMLSDHQVNQYLALTTDYVSHPWEIWRLVTYGFAHSPLGLSHILFNMYGLWLFGREVENVYGPREFLRFYLAAIVFSGLVWLAVQLITGTPASIIGASGGVTAVTLLFVLNFPFRQLLLFFVLPIPAWVLGVAFILLDMSGAISGRGEVAFEAHLAGAAFAFLYFRSGWRFERLGSFEDLRLRWKRTVGPGRNLRIHDEADNVDPQQRLDQILAKISEHGESSLTADERQFLTDTSRRFQRRRQ